MALAPAATLFEISWEVCNKVGGIYTVLQSKAFFFRATYEQYVTIGPHIEGGNAEFEELPIPEHWRETLAACARKGVQCRYGKWLITGEPIAIIIDSRGLLSQKNDLKFKLWERYQIDSLRASWEFDEPLCFATAAGMLIEEYALRNNERVVAHCHEWMAGFALLHLKATSPKVGTVFTTHATILGRTIAGNGEELYGRLEQINAHNEAYRFHIEEKHLTERACAHAADVFTTVSEITALEAKHLLERTPDLLLYNGFHTERFATFEETSIRHNRSRDLLREFTATVFLPHYPLDVEKTLFFFTSGRYEFRNKGMDVLIEALGKLNEQLRNARKDLTIVVFFWVIMGRRGPKIELLESKNFYSHVKSSVEWHSKALLQRVVHDFLSGHEPGVDDLYTSAFMRTLASDIQRFHKSGPPVLATHEIGDEGNDPALQAFRAHGLLNRAEDRVKVLLYPGYLDGSDGLLNLSYYDATVGAHLGIFPSTYEPWGYTPLESAVLGVPAVTTDLSGFGQYVKRTVSQQNKGVIVLDALGKNRSDLTQALADTLSGYAALEHGMRVEHGFAAKDIASLCDWKTFAQRYLDAHAMAVSRHEAS